jgi:hypothetical protein
VSSLASPEGEGGKDEVPVPYRERVEDLRRLLVAQGSLGLLLIDTSALAQVEHQYGTSAFEKVMAMARDLVVETPSSSSSPRSGAMGG